MHDRVHSGQVTGRRILGTAVLLAAMLPVGCSHPLGTQQLPGSVSLVPITFPDWQRKLAGYKGDMVVVDFWATWCGPCVERFPHMVKLYDQYKPLGVRFISVSLDDITDRGALEKARVFLKRQRATFENYLMEENVTDAFEKLDLLSVPAVLIYGRDGRLRYKLTGDDPNHQFTNGDVDKAIQELLGSSGNAGA